MALGRKIKWILIKNNKDEIINWLNLEKTIKETIPRTRRIKQKRVKKIRLGNKDIKNDWYQNKEVI